ncbi:MAG: 23S rRNA (adenine(1618)-N(6))-methyltransferase RlmF [Amphritea sp.]|nr:23S rRNA (adenine(1618)-N(6))-methyltransferase RlmF [Amphritea sp.]
MSDTTSLHPRNRHRDRYNLPELVQAVPELAAFIVDQGNGRQTLDFHNPAAVKALNKALLADSYGIRFWDIPDGYLCPPVPGRADYIHHLADLLAKDNGGDIPGGRRIKGLDIGVGANCIYPIIGNREYGWQFVGADIDPVAVNMANLICQGNPALKGAVECRQQTKADNIFRQMIRPDEQFDFTLCNPPFHASAEDAAAGTARKLRNLGKAADKTRLNFGGQSNELWCDGGERAFILRMIEQSREVGMQCYLFSTLVSKKENLSPLSRALKQAGAKRIETVKMAQGNKVSRFLVWSFLSNTRRQAWREQRW